MAGPLLIIKGQYWSGQQLSPSVSRPHASCFEQATAESSHAQGTKRVAGNEVWKLVLFVIMSGWRTWDKTNFRGDYNVTGNQY